MSYKRKRILSNLHIAGFDRQEYDPDLVAVDKDAVRVARDRLARGFGAPPIVPYAQGLGGGLLTNLPNFGIRDRLTTMFPKLKDWIPAPAPTPTRR
jgi:hypothetical protein